MRPPDSAAGHRGIPEGRRKTNIALQRGGDVARRPPLQASSTGVKAECQCCHFNWRNSRYPFRLARPRIVLLSAAGRNADRFNRDRRQPCRHRFTGSRAKSKARPASRELQARHNPRSVVLPAGEHGLSRFIGSGEEPGDLPNGGPASGFLFTAACIAPMFLKAGTSRPRDVNPST